MEISHDAYDWRCYASEPVMRLHLWRERKKGVYTMEDVVTEQG